MSGDSRWTLGLIPVALGLLVFFLCFWVAVANYHTAADATAVLGIVGTTIGTVVGAYFGVAVGSSGKDASDKAAAQAQDRADAAETRAAQAHDTALRAAAMVTDPGHQQALLDTLR